MSESPFRTPLIEGRLSKEVTLPIFIRALTQGTRVILLPTGFGEAPDHLERAAEIVREHGQNYPHQEYLPVDHYAYIVAPGHSYRFTPEGVLIGRFYDHPTVAFVQTKGGKRFTFGN